MPAFTIKLQRRDLVAERTMAFHFDKPPGFQFKAGQSLDVTLVDSPETDAGGNTRTFSIASAPHEEHLLVATRLRGSAFKQVLQTAPFGTAVQAEGPMGSFTLHRDSAKRGVFLAGGIGITPFRAILLDATARQLGHQLWLFYSNNRPEDAAFLDELQKLGSTNPTCHVVATMTNMAKSTRTWSGETGMIDRDMLRRHVADLNGPIYYVAGPPQMVTSMREMLLSAGVDEDDVRSEEFAGY